MRAELQRRRHAHSSNYWRQGHPRYHGGGGGTYGGGSGFTYTGGLSEDDRLKDRFIIAVGLMVCLLMVTFPMHALTPHIIS